MNHYKTCGLGLIEAVEFRVMRLHDESASVVVRQQTSGRREADNDPRLAGWDDGDVVRTALPRRDEAHASSRNRGGYIGVIRLNENLALRSECIQNMCCNEASDAGWFMAPVNDLLQRIRTAHATEAHGRDAANESSLDANWLRVRGLLVQLHENLSGTYSRDVVSTILRKLDAEITLIETLVECPRRHEATVSFH